MAIATDTSPARLTRTDEDQRGRVLPLTRAGIWVLLILAALNGLFLYFLPAQAETDYAWSIKPSVNAAFVSNTCLISSPAPILKRVSIPPMSDIARLKSPVIA